jgi:iron-sulfur cluster insertion protein
LYDKSDKNCGAFAVVWCKALILNRYLTWCGYCMKGGGALPVSWEYVMNRSELIQQASPATTFQMLSLSRSACGKVAELVAGSGNAALKLRIFITGGGCAGFQYGFALDERCDEDDLRLDTDGVTVLVDGMSMQYLQGASIDYEEGLQGARFVIHNPNASSSCGCGNSFMV